jgi:hypothetical protein
MFVAIGAIAGSVIAGGIGIGTLVGGAVGLGADEIMNSVDNSNDISSAANQMAQEGQSVQQEAQMSPEALAQLMQSYQSGQYLNQLYGQTVGQPGANAGGNLTAEQQYQNQGPLAQATYQDILTQAQNPTAGWQNTLAPQLEQAQNQINEYYNARGLDNSGIAIGSMGEAGVDLAIQNAQNEMQYQQQSLNNAQTLSTNASGLAQTNLQNLTGLSENQQSVGLSAQSMANQGLEAGKEMEVYPSQAALGSYYGSVAAQQALPGQLIGAGGQLGAAMMMS